MLFYRNIQCFTMAMPFNMISIQYKLSIFYIHVHRPIFYLIKSVLTFLYVNKISVYLSVLFEFIGLILFRCGYPSVVVKAACLGVGDRRFLPLLWRSGLKETKFLLRSLLTIQYCGEFS